MLEFKRSVALSLLLLLSISVYGQRRVQADVEVKNVSGKSVLTTTKSVYCANNGRLVVSFHKPFEYILLTNVNGEATYYLPLTNEVMSENSGMNNSKDEMLSLFLSGRLEDMGLGLYGYTLSSTRVDEDGNVIKTFSARQKDIAPKVEIVYKDYLPIYVAYFDLEGKVTTKTYLSQYRNVGMMPFPHRSTTIMYEKKDSTIVRTVYSNVKLDTSDPMFDFQVPSDAKAVDLSRFKK